MNWSILGESVTGTSHRVRNIECQDAFRFSTFTLIDKELLVIIAADGAGSASHAATGAKLVCDEFTSLIKALDPDTLLTNNSMIGFFTAVRNTMFTKAKSLNIRPRDLACTVLFALVGPVAAVFAQIGDGAIVVGKQHNYQVLFWPEPGEYVNTTDFLTDDNFSDALRFEILEDRIDEIAVFTDGMQRLALNFISATADPEFFLPLFKQLRTVTNMKVLAKPFRNFLDSRRVNARTDDDKTLIVAVRAPLGYVAGNSR